MAGANDVIVEFDPTMYGPITEGDQQSVIFRLTAQPPPTTDITVLFSTQSNNSATGI